MLLTKGREAFFPNGAAGAGRSLPTARPSGSAKEYPGRKSVQCDKICQSGIQCVQPAVPVGPLDHKTHPADGLPIIEPHVSELLCGHCPVAPTRISQQHAIAVHPPKDHEVVLPKGIDGYHDRRVRYKVVQIKSAEPDPSVTPRLRIALEIQQRETLANVYQVGIVDVFFAFH